MRIQVTGELSTDDIQVTGGQPFRVINVTNSLVPDPIGRSEIGAPGGVAALDESGTLPADQIPETVALTENTARRSLGTYIPPDWGTKWRAARDGAKAGGKAKLLCVGDSITMGFHSSSNVTAAWAGRLRTALQAEYGDGGGGFLGSMNSRISATGSNEIVAAWTAAGGWATYTGTWTADTASVMGPGIYSVDTTTAGSTITFPSRGTIAKIYTITGGTRAGYTYSIDGGPQVPVADNGAGGAANIQVTTATGLADTKHTVTITYAGTGSPQKLSVVGVSGENTSGITVDNLGRSGARSAGFAVNTPSALNAVWNGGASYPGDCVIYGLGVNDAANNNAADGWAANMAKYLSAVRESGDGSTDLIILMNHIGTFEGTNFKWQDYVTRARGLADAYNAALVDMWAIGRNSWNYWQQQGRWGTSTSPGAAGTDPVHLSDAGHAAIADAMLPILTS